MNKIHIKVKKKKIISFKHKETTSDKLNSIPQMDQRYSCSNGTQNPTNLLVLSISDKIRTKQNQLFLFVFSKKK